MVKTKCENYKRYEPEKLWNFDNFPKKADFGTHGPLKLNTSASAQVDHLLGRTAAELS
jgi:hypothetical protein